MPDDADAAMQQIMRLLADEVFDGDFTWRRLGAAVVCIPDEMARVYIKLAFEGGRPTYQDGSPVLEADEVLISDQHRAECDRLLREVCSAKAQRLDLMYLATNSKGFGTAFAEAYAKVTGLPSPASCTFDEDAESAPSTPQQAMCAESLFKALEDQDDGEGQP